MPYMLAWVTAATSLQCMGFSGDLSLAKNYQGPCLGGVQIAYMQSPTLFTAGEQRAVPFVLAKTALL